MHFNISVAERILSEKFINIFDKRLSVFPILPSTTNRDEHFSHQATSTPPPVPAASQQTRPSDEQTQDHIPLKETIRRASDKPDFYSGSVPPDTQVRIPPRKPGCGQGEMSDAVDLERRTVYIQDVPDSLVDVLEAWFVSPKHGGGTVDKFYFDDDNHIAVVTFADVQGLSILL